MLFLESREKVLCGRCCERWPIRAFVQTVAFRFDLNDDAGWARSALVYWFAGVFRLPGEWTMTTLPADDGKDIWVYHEVIYVGGSRELIPQTERGLTGPSRTCPISIRLYFYQAVTIPSPLPNLSNNHTKLYDEVHAQRILLGSRSCEKYSNQPSLLFLSQNSKPLTHQ